MATTTQDGGFAVKKKSRSSERDRLASPLGMTALYVILIGGALLAAFPFYYTLVTMTHRTAAILSIPPPIWFGGDLAQNYSDLLDALPFWNALFNSIVISTIHTVLVLFFCSLAGYGFAKFQFPGREPLLGFLLATLMVPGSIGIIPLFICVSQPALDRYLVSTNYSQYRQRIRDLLDAPVYYQRSAGRYDGRGADRRRARVPDLLEHHCAGDRPGAGRAGDPDLHGQVERFPDAAADSEG
jgi:hypothetical protein